MDEAFELEDYLPVEFRDASESKYIDTLWSFFKNSYLSGDYQFSFIAYHMLMMSFLYFVLWKIKTTRTDDFGYSLIGFGKDIEKSVISASSPFTFHEIRERSVFRLLKIVDCNDDKIGKYVRLVDERNKAAHSNGVTSFDTQSAIDSQVAEMVRIAKEIQEITNPVIEELYASFLEASSDLDNREHLEDSDQIQEVLLRENYLSKADISCCQGYDLSNILADKKGKATISLHNELGSFAGLMS